MRHLSLNDTVGLPYNEANWLILLSAMLRRMRTFLTLLLCLLLPLQVLAVSLAMPVEQAAVADEIPCPMERPTPADDDCCNDMATYAHTGQLCKSDAPCNPLSAVALAATSFATASPLLTQPPTRVYHTHLTIALANLWRPPISG